MEEVAANAVMEEVVFQLGVQSVCLAATKHEVFLVIILLKRPKTSPRGGLAPATTLMRRARRDRRRRRPIRSNA